MWSDPIADLLTRIRNGIKASHETIEVPASKLKTRILEILKEEGFISDFSFIDDRRQGILKVYLKYYEPKKNMIKGLERKSKPGRKIYLSKDEIPDVLGGIGIAILSTSKGVMTGEKAKKLGIGGEYICAIW